jgi:hypothetical protein
MLAMGQWSAKRAVKRAGFVLLAVTGFYALRFTLFIVFMAYLLHTRDLMDASAENRARRRGGSGDRLYRRAGAPLQDRDQPEARRPLVFNDPDRDPQLGGSGRTELAR